MADDFNPVVWVSLASVSGLSLVSLGQPGLRTDLDEQVYTGGLTAVQAMLGGEVGGDTDRFVGGSHSNRTGRFLVRNDKGGELVGQFLLISRENISVAHELVEHYEEILTIFAEDTLETEVYERIVREFRALGVNDVLDLFFNSILKARKRKSIPMDNNLFFTAINQAAAQSINDYEYSATLVKIAEFKGKFSELSSKLKAERNDLFVEFAKDLLEFLTSEYPHALVRFPKLNSVRKDFLKYVRTEIDNLEKQGKVKEGLNEIIHDFEKNELKKVLTDFTLHEVNKTNLRIRIEDEIFEKFRREFPLLFLIDPDIDGFLSAIEHLTIKINEEYDLAGTLSRIGHDMLINHEKKEELIIPYIRHFCEQFFTGLTFTAWKYMQIVFRIITSETSVDVTDVLPALKNQIPESHFTNVQKMITKYKITKIDPLSFSVKKATDILPFYRALFSSLGFGMNTIICKEALGEENPDNFLKYTVRNFSEFSISIFYPFAIFAIFSYLERIQQRLEFPIAYPKINLFEKDVKIDSLTPESIIHAFIKANKEKFQKEQKFVQQRFSEFNQAFEKRIQDIEKFLSQNKPIDISKGYSLEFKELSKLDFSVRLANEAEKIIQNAKIEYEKIIRQAEPNLANAKDSAQQFLDGKIAEKKLNKILTNLGFLKKIKDNYGKTFRKIIESIDKKYNELPSIIEKRFQGFNKDFTRQFSAACAFLKVDRKSIMRGEHKFISESTKLINQIQSSINQIMNKEQLLTWDNLGAYFFYSKGRSLPTNLRFEISNSLAHKKDFPLLKESIELLKKRPTSDVYKSYAEILEEHSKSIITRLFQEISKLIGKNAVKTDPDIFFVERDEVPIPIMEMGILTNADAMDSIRSILGGKIAIESENREESPVFHVSAVIPDFGCDFKTLKRVWKTKDWSVRKVFLLLSWYSFLKKNEFYVDLLRYSSAVYSDRVRESIDEIFEYIGRQISFY
ncbi:MAG: hypothetical protein ACXAC8_05915 [Candidatus Hodarchaeales archaeon]|jgi:hypothetical protein